MEEQEDRPFRLSLAFWVSFVITIGGMVAVGLAGWGWMAVGLVPAVVLALTLAVNVVRVLLAERKERGEEDDA